VGVGLRQGIRASPDRPCPLRESYPGTIGAETPNDEVVDNVTQVPDVTGCERFVDSFSSISA